MGLGYAGTGRVHDAETLSPTQRHEIERCIFGPVPNDQKQFINEYRNRLAVTYDVAHGRIPKHDESDEEEDFHPSTIIPINLNTMACENSADVRVGTPYTLSLKWRQFAELIDARRGKITNGRAEDPEGIPSEMREVLSAELVEQYIGMVCHYTNKVRGGPPSTILIHRKDFGRLVDDSDAVTIDDIKQRMRRSRNGFAGVTKENFSTYDYIFIPYATEPEGSTGHYRLFGFAPKEKIIFALDSVSAKEHMFIRLPEIEVILKILQFIVPDVEERKQWKASMLIGKHNNGGELVRQKDKWNCGIFVCTNVINMAFGYALDNHNDDEIGGCRKPRMVAELNNKGFSGLYKYDLISYPKQFSRADPNGITDFIRKQSDTAGSWLDFAESSPNQGSETGKPTRSESTSELRTPDAKGGPIEASSPLSELPSVSPGSVLEGMEEYFVVGNSNEAEDLNEARGLENILTQANTDKIGATLKARPVLPTASECLQLDVRTGLVRPESAPQRSNPPFTKELFKSFKCFYSFPYIKSKEALACTKGKMIEACKDFPVANWEQNQHLEKEDFLEWMKNEMGATYARICRDEIELMLGRGEGYRLWQEWKASGGRDNYEIAEEARREIFAYRGELAQKVIKKQEVREDEPQELQQNSKRRKLSDDSSRTIDDTSPRE